MAAKDLLPLKHSGEKRFWEHPKINIAYALFTIELNHHQSLIHINKHNISHHQTFIISSSIVGIIKSDENNVFNRPGVAGAVLQIPPSLIDSVSNSSFPSKYSKHHNSQTVRARDLKF